MANKFLPFIVEKSPLHSIYQTMLTRSKGINNITFITVFYIIGSLGIKTVRDFVDSQAEKMSTEELYRAIINHFNLEIDVESYKAVLLLRHVLGSSDLAEGNEKFNEYNTQDLLGFIYVVTVLGKNADYFKVDYSNYLENNSHVMENLQEFITLTDDIPDETIYASTLDELKAKILYISLIAPRNPDHTYQVVAVDENKEEDEGEGE